MDIQKKNKKVRKRSFLNRLKRKNVEQGFSRLSLIILIPVFFGVSIFMIAAPRSEESQIEKRKLEKFPDFSIESLISGEYTAAVTKWYDDTVPFRDDFKNIGNEFKSFFGIETGESVNITGQPVTVVSQPETENKNNDKKISENSKDSKNSEISKPDENSKNQESEIKEDIKIENGIIVVKQNGHYRALELFGGGTGNNYVNTLNNLHKDFGDKVHIYSMPAPLASEFYTPESHSNLTASQKDCFDRIAERLDEGITSVDITSVLAQHTNEDIYLRTDHHWSPLGGYYAAKEFANAAGVDFKDISTFKAKTVKDFVGTMYGFTGDANLNKDRENFIYYVPDNNSKCTAYYYTTDFKFKYSDDFFNDVGDPEHNAYLIYMGGDDCTVKIKTNVKNGRKLMIIKDSYGNVIPSFLFNSFEEIYIADMRYFKLNLVDFANQMKITDMLFTMVTYSVVGENADNLEVLRTQAKGRKIIDEAAG